LSEQQKPTVLLVDDEEAVHALVLAVLKTQGYSTLTARDSDEALRLSDSHEGPIHLLITDVVMPPFMAGSELAQCMRMLRPEVKVLYISGYHANDLVLDEVGDATADFLSKPFSPDLLLEKVRRLTGASSSV
jgi:two-component system cell cycle sensor histidine kinase/response regulator CckA